uniref:hypothetical protein n=1 Tax=Lactobacillus crispatus TaxID=47770 RepID=UPI0021BD59DA|nr:hypothetical protein [Lactobacillus crispatus]UVZ00339.1 hypothetical protein [Lactobacillus crispatus]
MQDQQLELFSFDRIVPDHGLMDNSLVHKKFGINKLKNLKILDASPTDKLWDSFRKTAYFIYQNCEWTWSDYLNAATYLFPFLGFEKGSKCPNPLEKEWAKDSKNVDKEEIHKLGLLAGRYSTYNYAIKIILHTCNGRSHYLVLTNDHLKLETSGTIYSYKGKHYDFTYISKGMLLGFSKLVKNLIAEYQKNNHGIEQQTFFRTIEGLLSGKRTTSYMSLEHFVEDTSWINDSAFALAESYAKSTGHPFSGFNDGIKTKDFIKMYLSRNYSEILMQKHENNLVVLTRSERWHKHTNLQVPLINAMYSSPLQKDFLELCIDDNFELECFHQAEKKIDTWIHLLPQTNKQPVLKFKKLPKKLGVYLVSTNQIVLDPRRKQISNGKYEEGANTFVHEYGHFLDYQYLSTSNTTLSMSSDFSPILQAVSSYVVKSNIKKEQSKLLIPTEVFARSLELYLFNAASEPSLTTMRKYYEHTEYNVIRKAAMSQVVIYFDKLFPDLKKQLEKVKVGEISA